MDQEQIKKDRTGFIVLWSLVAFFVTFASVDAFFIYKAAQTHVGVITEDAYEKGLAYNKTLEQARQQKEMNIIETAKFDNAGILKWTLLNKDKTPIIGATVTANIFRPIKDERDINLVLHYKGEGLYQATPDAPLEAGIWTVKLEVKWLKQKYQKTLTFIKK